MRKTIQLLLLLLVLPLWAQAQIVTTTPDFPTEDAALDILFDASLGTGGLKGYTGTDVYAHAGVITDKSTSDGDWKYAPAWLTNTPKYQLTKVSGDIWKLSITPNIREYFGVPEGETIKKIALVFRNGTGSKEGKDTGGKDVFVEVYQQGLNVSFLNPTKDQAIASGTTVEVKIGSSTASDLSLLVNGTSVANLSSTTTLTHSYTFSSALDYTLVAKATSNGKSVYDTLYVCVPEPVKTEARPSGLLDGITYPNTTSATLILHAPGKANVFVIGDFNDWIQLNKYQMKKDGDYWWITLTDLTPGKLYGFQYLVDGTMKVSDPYTELILDPWNDKYINQTYNIYPNLPAYPDTKTDGLVSTLQTQKASYNWEVTNFTMPSQENMVIYELLLRDFTTEQSLEAAIQKLSYLQTLGITAIELMPIQEFDGNNSWGYNPNHYFAPDKAYGSPEMYKRFIDECHKRGIAVLLDMVFNQSSGLCPFAALYWDSVNNRPAANNPWMNPVAPHPYAVLDDFNHDSQYTRNYFKRVLQYWINEYKIDGYRMDLTKGFTQKQSTESTASKYDQSRIDILTDYYNAAKSTKSDVMFILEHFCDYDEELVLANKGMYLWRNINNAYSQAAMGYQADSDFSGMNSTPRKWVGFAESHDEERNFYKAKTYGAGDLKTNEAARLARIPLNIAFTTLIPGPKMIWQFGELGYDYSINSFGGRTDPKPSPFTENWLDIPARRAGYDNSALILHLRKAYPNAFNSGTVELNVGQSDWTQGRRIAIKHSDINIITVGNFQPAATITSAPNFTKTGTWYELLTGEELNVTSTSMTLSIAPGEVRIYTDRKPVVGIEDNVVDGSLNIKVEDNKLSVLTSEYVKNISVYNLQGVLVAKASNTSEINIGNIIRGYYIVKVDYDGASVSQKFVKK